MLLSAVSVLVVAQSSSEIPEGLMNNPVFTIIPSIVTVCLVTRVLVLASMTSINISHCVAVYCCIYDPKLEPPS